MLIAIMKFLLLSITVSYLASSASVLHVNAQVASMYNFKSETEPLDFKARRINTLMKTNQIVAGTAEEYIRLEESRLSKIKSALHYFKSNFVNESKQSTKNPINAFKLIKLLSKDLENLLNNTKPNVTEDLRSQLNNTGLSKRSFPMDRDWQNAVVELTTFHSRTILTAPFLVQQLKYPGDKQEKSATEFLDDGYDSLLNKNYNEADEALNDALLMSYYEEKNRKDSERVLEKREDSSTLTCKSPTCGSNEDEVSLRMQILRGLGITAYQRELLDNSHSKACK